MKQKIGRILWIDDRIENYYEGQIIDDNGFKYYFNYSTCLTKPMKNQLLRFEVEETDCCLGAINVRDFLNRGE